MVRQISLALLFIGLMAGGASAQEAVCDVMWRGSNAAQQEDIHVSMDLNGLLERGGNHYPLRNITEVIHQHVSANCANRYNALPADRRTEQGYMGYLLGLNPELMPKNANDRVTLSATIPKNQFMEVIADKGINLGLPGGKRGSPTAGVPASVRHVKAPKRRTAVIPGCMSCTTPQSD